MTRTPLQAWSKTGSHVKEGAAVAIAHKILVAAFHMQRRAVVFADLSANYLDRVGKHRTAKGVVRRLDALDYAVMLRPEPAS